MFLKSFLQLVIIRLISLITCQNLNWKIFIFLYQLLTYVHQTYFSQRFPLYHHEELMSTNFSSDKVASPFKQNYWAEFHTDSDLCFPFLVPFSVQTSYVQKLAASSKINDWQAKIGLSHTFLTSFCWKM